MKKRRLEATPATDSAGTDPHRRRLLAALGLLGGAVLVRTPGPQAGPRLLSLREADFYTSKDLAG